MTDLEWRTFLLAGRRVCGQGSWDAALSTSWCAFTTFSSLRHGIHYLNCGFPEAEDCLESEVRDGGTWRQCFKYADLAHIAVPATFYWERVQDGQFESGSKHQDLQRLAAELDKSGIPYRRTDLMLEVKLY